MRRFLAYFCSALALGALARDVWNGPMQGAPLLLTSTAEFWAAAHRGSLVAFGAEIESLISTTAWQEVVLPALLLPAVAGFGALALLFFLLAGVGRRRAR